jgi:hypothetical protein
MTLMETMVVLMVCGRFCSRSHSVALYDIFGGSVLSQPGHVGRFRHVGEPVRIRPGDAAWEDPSGLLSISDDEELLAGWRLSYPRSAVGPGHTGRP